MPTQPVIKPSFALEVSFTTGTFDTPVWVDIAPYVMMRPIRVSRGRNYEFDQVEAGSIDGIVLNNAAGHFSPDNTTGFYYPNILPLKQIRLRVILSGVSYDIFRGYITSWTPEITLENRKRLPVVNLEITDIFGLLSKIDIKEYTIEDSELLAVAAHVEDNFDLQPTEYRTIAFVGDDAAIAGNLTIVGEQLESGTLDSEIVVLNGTNEVRTANRYKSVATITFPARTATGQHVAVYTAGFANEYGEWAQYNLFRAYELPLDRQTSSGTFQTIMEDMPASGDTVLGRLQKIALTEGGTLFVNKSGQVQMNARYVRSLAGLTNTFDDVSTTNPSYENVQYSIDDSLLVNTAEYQTTDGSTRYVQDTTSIATYGRRYGSVPDVYSSSSTFINTIAGIAAKRYATPEQRIKQLTFKAQSSGMQTWLLALQAEIGQYYRVLNTPATDTNTRRDSYAFVERVEHAFDLQLIDWRTTLTLSPENVNVWFTLDKHALDDNKRLGY